MSLYHEAAEILEKAKKDGGSLKSLVFSKKNWKSDPKTLFALTTEAAKWSEVLSDIVERSGVLTVEKNLTPTLALLLTHDLFLSKKGIALPQSHGLNSSASRHKVRLSAELTKARLRRGFPSLDALREHINSEAINAQSTTSNGETKTRHPRWIRINTIKSPLDEVLRTAFEAFTEVSSLKDITHADARQRLFYVDEHIPNLIAIIGPDDPTKFDAYKQGKLILQEKASCFPAYLLDPKPDDGDVIDACAAPGNKTTHLAAALANSQSRVIACEKDPKRSETLTKMVKLAGANSIVTVKQKQDFLRLDPAAKEFANVTSLLLDPSCSGSGIFGRDEATVTVRLPSTSVPESAPKSKKRKRGGQKAQPKPEPGAEDAITEETPDQEAEDESKLKARLENLSTFQLRLLERAMAFPAAKRISYSTCSIHAQENENVVVKALQSDVAKSRGWRVLRRDEQVDGMKRWQKRGSEDAVRNAMSKAPVVPKEVAEACIRCEKGGEDGTMGFFVAGFVKDESLSSNEASKGSSDANIEEDEEVEEEDEDEEEEWNGFSEDQA